MKKFRKIEFYKQDFLKTTGKEFKDFSDGDIDHFIDYLFRKLNDKQVDLVNKNIFDFMEGFNEKQMGYFSEKFSERDLERIREKTRNFLFKYGEDNYHKEISRLRKLKKEHLQKIYADFMDSGGYSRRMVNFYTKYLVGGTLALGLLGGMVVDWMFFSVRTWFAMLCFILSLAPLFLYRYGQLLDKVFKRATTPLYFRNKGQRFGLIAVSLSLLGLSFWLIYPSVRSELILAIAISVSFWLLNKLTRYHIAVTVYHMNDFQDEARRKEGEGHLESNSQL